MKSRIQISSEENICQDFLFKLFSEERTNSCWISDKNKPTLKNMNLALDALNNNNNIFPKSV